MRKIEKNDENSNLEELNNQNNLLNVKFDDKYEEIYEDIQEQKYEDLQDEEYKDIENHLTLQNDYLHMKDIVNNQNEAENCLKIVQC